MAHEIFGYYDDADATVPAFDPGIDVACPVCGEPLHLQPRRTCSLMLPGDTKSYFYRAHRACADATPDRLTEVESELMDARAALWQ